MLLFVLLVSCKNFFYGATRNMRYVYDYNYWQDGIPSYQVNRDDMYCFYYSGTRNQIKIEPKKMEKANQQVITFLKNKNLKIKEEIFIFEYNNGTEKDNIKNFIRKREMDNNFKNCDYLLTYELSNYNVNNPELPLSDIYLDIDIYDIKTDKRIGTYTMHEDDTVFNKKTQEEKIEKMLTEWWKTQIKPQPKARPLETWCVGNCDNNKNNKNE